MFNLFKYFFKKRINVLIALSVIVTVAFAVIIGTSRLVIHQYDTTICDTITVPNLFVLVVYPIILFLLAFFVPSFEFSFKMKKRGIDQMYSLPIKREKLYLVKFLICLCEIVIPFLIGSHISIFVIMSMEHMYNLAMFIPFFLLLIVCSIGVTLISSCAFIHQNTEIDGVVNSFFFFVFIAISVSALNILSFKLFDYKFKFVLPKDYFLISPLISIYNGIAPLLGKDYEKYYNWEINNTIAIIVFVLLSFGAFFLSYYHIKKEKSEYSQQISSSLFGYRLFIPIFAIAISINVSEVNVLLFLYQIVTYFLYVLYLRKFKLDKKYALIVALLILVSVVIGLAMHAIK